MSTRLQEKLFSVEKDVLDTCFKEISYGILNLIEQRTESIDLSHDPHREIRSLYALLDQSMGRYQEILDVLKHLPESHETITTISKYSTDDFSLNIQKTLKEEKKCIVAIMNKSETPETLVDIFKNYQQNVKLPFVRCKNGLEYQLLMEKTNQINILCMVLLWNSIDERRNFVSKLLL